MDKKIPDYDHVAPFKDGHVSWVESYEYIGRIGNGYHYKIKTENSGFLDAVFCRATDFWDVVDKTPIIAKSFRECSFWIIVEDYLPGIEIDRFIYTRKKPFVPYFMDAHSSIHHNSLTWNLLDGVIQEKLQEICERCGIDEILDHRN
jgi:hypothetical protein